MFHRIRSHAAAGLGVVALVSGAVHSAGLPSVAAAAEDLHAAVGPSDSLLAGSETTEAPEVPKVLRLDAALQLASRHDPLLRSSAWSVREAHARAGDAAKWPNPEVVVDAEGLGGDLGTDRAEWTFGFVQEFELGGDRGARGAKADAATRTAGYEFQAARLGALEATAEAFLSAWVAQERRARFGIAEEIAEATVAAAEARFRAGAAPEVDRIRAEGNRALLVAQRRQAEAELAAASRRLARRWGMSEATFDSLRLDDPPASDPPSADELLARLELHPAALAAASELETAHAEVRLARATRVPNVELGAGYRRLEETAEDTFVVGLALPVPLWNSGGGAVGVADAALASVEAKREVLALEQEISLRNAVAHLRGAQAVHAAVRDEFLPSTRRALEEVGRGYREGRFTFLDLLQSQRAALEAEMAVLDATREAWSAQLALDRLVTGAERPNGEGGAR